MSIGFRQVPTSPDYLYVVARGYSLAGIEKDKPCCYGQEWQEELAGNWYYERGKKEGCNRSLDQGSWPFNHGEGENAEDGEEKVLGVIIRPPMPAQSPQSIRGFEGGVQGGDGGGG